ncbi:MAG: hypothetical protein P8L32_01965 [Paracoccaceae bacterium]|nr:hypothetical protein [Paracoccaceae bacterium]
MRNLLTKFMGASLAKPAMFVPTAIMIIFSVFSLTAPNDPSRILSAFELGIVNDDKAPPFPPIVVSERLLEGVTTNLPLNLVELATREQAEQMVEQGKIGAALIFGEDFSANAINGEQVSFEILSSQHLTIAEVQVVGQLKAVLPAAMSAGVAGIQLAMSKGQMPTGEMPVSAKINDLVVASAPASISAPFVMLYTTWLAGLVGAILLFMATKSSLVGKEKAIVSTLLPIATTGLSTFMLSMVIGATVAWDLVFEIWPFIWVSALALTWLFYGLISVFSLASLVLWLPVVFYQSAIGGVMTPRSAAPAWMDFMPSWIEFEALGAAYRGLIHGVDMGYPTAMMGIFAAIGLILIWSKALILDRTAA